MIPWCVYTSLVCFMNRHLDVVEGAKTWASIRTEVKLLHSSAVGIMDKFWF